MMEADLLVIGAGAAGLMAAIAAARRFRAAGVDKKVVVLEKMPRPGVKLLTSGSGRCNLTHEGQIADFLGHYGDHGRFLKPALYGFDNRALLAFFETRGLSFVTEESGKIFPESGKARDVLDVLLRELSALKVDLVPGSPVLALEKSEEGFRVRTASGEYAAPVVCISTGGLSYPGTGSSGDGFSLAAKLGHSIAETAPCLSPVTIDPWAFASCSGFALRDAPIELCRGGKKVAAASGDVLFTHTGLSGPGILDFSRRIRPGDVLRIPLADNPGTIDARMLEEIAVHGLRETRTLLQAFGLPERLARALAEACGIDPARRSCDLDKTARKSLALALGGLSFSVARLGDYSQAMATRGGVDLAEVTPRSMESRVCPGLYFAGEVLDIDGDTGGYNLQAAFSTGNLAGASAAAALMADSR